MYYMMEVTHIDDRQPIPRSAAMDNAHLEANWGFNAGRRATAVANKKGKGKVCNIYSVYVYQPIEPR